MKRGLAVFILIASGLVGLTASASASSTNLSVAITGSVQCTHGEPVEGVWVNSSLGGSGWAKTLSGHDATVKYFRYPATSSVTLPYGTYISIHVGCGVTESQWASDNRTPGVVVHHDGHLIINAYSCQPSQLATGQTIVGSCDTPPEGKVGSSTANPFATASSGAIGYCTCGAAYLWFKNTGWYPKWTGNAIDWASNAQTIGWHVSSYPMEHALIVWPNSMNHVGYVTSINVATRVLTFIDMNGGNDPNSQEKTSLFGVYDSKSCKLGASQCTSARLGTVGNYLAGAEFIAANPGYDWSWGSAAYPQPSAGCKPS